MTFATPEQCTCGCGYPVEVWRGNREASIWRLACTGCGAAVERDSEHAAICAWNDLVKTSGRVAA